MLIAAAQLNPVVGDIAANAEAIAAAVAAARRAGARVLVGTELGVIGYPPRDLVLRRGVAQACVAAVDRLAAAYPDMVLLLGLPRPVVDRGRPIANSVALCRGGRVEAFYDKRLLPTYDVFDEDRYFAPGTAPLVFDHEGTKLGVLICEDLWSAADAGNQRRYPIDPAAETLAAGASNLVVLSASPFVVGKDSLHLRHASDTARRLQARLLICNQVGANDDLIFDGGSFMVARDGAIAVRLPRFEERAEIMEFGEGTTVAGAALNALPVEERDAELFGALTLGIRDYFRKTGHRQAVIGLSGGIDSALVAALVSAAIGPANVHALLMPGLYSSPHSLTDAIESASRLRLGSHQVIGIDAAHLHLRERFDHMLGRFEGVSDENLQSRLRGLHLMAFSNSVGALVVTTGNKSEYATGYATLYGDMCGGLAPIGDLLKGQVYSLARYLNSAWKKHGFREIPIPENSLAKAPSAELRPNQTDQETLPRYEDLDRIVDLVVGGDLDADAVAEATGIDAALVSRWCAVIDREQYKRDQAPVILKVSARSFGRGRPMPIAGRFRPQPHLAP